MGDVCLSVDSSGPRRSLIGLQGVCSLACLLSLAGAVAPAQAEGRAEMSLPVILMAFDDDDEVSEPANPLAVAVRNRFQIGDVAFDKLVFGVVADAAAGRTQLDKLLTFRIDSMQEFCALTPAQRKKLWLAGGGDITRFMGRVESLREQIQNPPDAERRQACIEEARALHSFFNSGVFGRNSIFAKTTRSVLSPEQLARFARSGLDWRPTVKRLPDRVDWGTVRVGAVAQASVRLVFQGDLDPEMTVQSQSPAFVRVSRHRMGKQETADAGNSIHCDIGLALETGRAGEFQGTVQVTADGVLIEIPVAARVLDAEPGLPRVLVIETPFRAGLTNNAAVFDPWLELMKSAKVDVDYVDVDPERPVLRDWDLSRFDIVWLGPAAIHFAQDSDWQQLTRFVEAGGRVIVEASPSVVGSLQKANHFLTPLGLWVDDKNPSGVNNQAITITGDGIRKHPLTEGVRRLSFRRPATIFLDQNHAGQILVAARDAPGAGFVALVRAGRGEVVVVGTAWCWNWIAENRDSGTDNSLLLRNLLKRP
jgi:hypothetical protein